MLQGVLHVNNIPGIVIEISFSHVYDVSYIAPAKILEREESISPFKFMGSCPTINHTFLALATQWMSSPSRKWELGVSPRLCFIVICVWCELGETGGRWSSRFPCVTPVVEIFSLDRVALRILSNINDRVPLWKQQTA